jgi:hypothetical protein
MGNSVAFLSVLLLLVVGVISTDPSCTVSIIGAGPGGLYTAWRLATSTLTTRIPASKICVFEQESRVGGRVYTVRSVPGVPEVNGYDIDMGAHRYNPQGEFFTSSVINALGLSSTLYPPSDCTQSSPLSYFLRNVPVADASTSNGWPYNFLPYEKWGPGNPQPSQPLPEQIIFGVYPFILSDFYVNLTNPNPAIKWKAVSDVLNLIKVTPVATAQNLLASNLNARVAFGDIYSSEVWQAAIDTQWSGASWVYQFNLFWAAREVIAQLVAINSVAPSAEPYRVTDGGYAAWVEKLAAEFTGRGGRIFYDFKLESIDKFLGSTLLRFENDNIVATDTVLLNLPPHSIRSLGGSVNPFTNPAKPDVLVALNGVFNIHGVFVHVYYPDAFWANKLGRCSGSIVSTEVIRSVSYGDLQKKANGKYSGWVTAYIQGDDNAAFFRQPSPDNGEVLTVINSTNNGRALLSLIHSNLMKIHQNFFAARNISSSDIAAPTKGLVANWNPKNLGGIHATQPSPFDPSYILSLYQLPAKNSKVFYVNEATSPRNGWAEGSLIMAEKFLRNNFNLPRPSWLDQTFYNTWVQQNL